MQLQEESLQIGEESRIHREDNVRLKTEMESLKTLQTEKEKQWEQVNQHLEHSFQSLAAKALEGNNKQFLDLAKTVFSKESELAKGDLQQRQQAITELVSPLKENLDKLQSYNQEMERMRERSYSTVELELKKVIESNLTLSKETAALKSAFKRPHIRGKWGELQLKNCVEMAGMSDYSDITIQNNITQEDQRYIPDMTVKMPGGRMIIVDAKTPLDGFMESLESDSQEQQETELLRHGKHLRDHVRRLGSKDYGSHVKGAADFTVMFLPNESFLYAALESQPDLIEFALERKVLIATPPTFIGLLKVLRFGWNEEKMAENTQKISEAGKELHKRVCDFLESYVSMGKFIDKAKEEYQSSMTRLESRVLVQAKRLEKLGAKGKKEIPAEFLSLETPQKLESHQEMDTNDDEKDIHGENEVQNEANQ